MNEMNEWHVFMAHGVYTRVQADSKSPGAAAECRVTCRPSKLTRCCQLARTDGTGWPLDTNSHGRRS